MSLEVKWLKRYKKSDGLNIFVYEVKGPPAEIEKYKSVIGNNYRENENGFPIYHTPFYAGKTGKLELTRDESKYFIQNSDLLRKEAAALKNGKDMYLQITKQQRDVNWIFHVENIKIYYPGTYSEIYAINEEEYKFLKSKFLESPTRTHLEE